MYTRIPHVTHSLGCRPHLLAHQLYSADRPANRYSEKDFKQQVRKPKTNSTSISLVWYSQRWFFLTRKKTRILIPYGNALIPGFSTVLGKNSFSFFAEKKDNHYEIESICQI
jgi:hypothetical protein